MLTVEDKKDITSIVDKSIEKFAVIVANGFAHMDERFERIDERFDAIDRRFDGVDQRLDGMQGQINGTNNRIDELSLNYTRRDEYSKLEKRVTKLETKLAS